MIPLGDSVAGGRRPLVTQGLIAACVIVFLYELTLNGAALDQFVNHWGAVPRVVMAALAGDARVPRTELLTLVSSEFLHAGFLHLGGNMLFLWVFGRAVEDRIGSALYLPFYLLAGALAGLLQCVLASGGPGRGVALIGASGSIAAVLGLYFVSYPTAWVRVLVPILFFFWAFDLPAVVVLAFWFVSQFFTGLTAITQASGAADGVAVWAHVAGFVIGAASGLVLPRSSNNRVPGRAGTVRAGAVRRDSVPGPARLLSSAADLAALLLAARLVLRFFGLLATRPPLGLVSAPVIGLTEPIVGPVRAIVPDLHLLGRDLETATLVLILVSYLVAGLIGQLFLKRSATA